MFSIELFSLSFFWAVLIFAILSALFTWIVFKFLMRNAGSIVALTGLISTFLALLLTSLHLRRPLDIAGMGWVWGTLIVWICGMFIWLIPGPWRSHRKEGTRLDIALPGPPDVQRPAVLCVARRDGVRKG